jgi:hypothetical protein
MGLKHFMIALKIGYITDLKLEEEFPMVTILVILL